MRSSNSTSRLRTLAAWVTHFTFTFAVGLTLVACECGPEAQSTNPDNRGGWGYGNGTTHIVVYDDGGMDAALDAPMAAPSALHVGIAGPVFDEAGTALAYVSVNSDWGCAEPSCDFDLGAPFYLLSAQVHFDQQQSFVFSHWSGSHHCDGATSADLRIEGDGMPIDCTAHFVARSSECDPVVSFAYEGTPLVDGRLELNERPETIAIDTTITGVPAGDSLQTTWVWPDGSTGGGSRGRYPLIEQNFVDGDMSFSGTARTLMTFEPTLRLTACGTQSEHALRIDVLGL